MHLLTASITCCALLFIQGYAEEEGFQCKQNVPGKAEKALLDAINEQRSEYGIPPLRKKDYDCGLAKKASARDIGESLFPLNGESAFEKDWNETLTKALKKSLGYGMTKAAKRFGCEIKLTTSPNDGSHNVNLYCLLDIGSRRPLVDSAEDVTDASEM